MIEFSPVGFVDKDGRPDPNAPDPNAPQPATVRKARTSTQTSTRTRTATRATRPVPRPPVDLEERHRRYVRSLLRSVILVAVLGIVFFAVATNASETNDTRDRTHDYAECVMSGSDYCSPPR